MSSTLHDRLDVNHRKALGVSRQALIKVCRVRLNGDSPLDIYNGLNALQQKKLGFNKPQIEVIKSGCELEDMDITLLCDIIVAFGGNMSTSLNNSIKQLRQKRNAKAHEVRPSLTKSELKSELAEIHTVSKSILEELKMSCSPEGCSLLDGEIVNIGRQLSELEQTLEDNLQQKTEMLISASADMAAMIETMKEEAATIAKSDDEASTSNIIQNSVTGNVNNGGGVQINAGGGAVNYR